MDTTYRFPIYAHNSNQKMGKLIVDDKWHIRKKKKRDDNNTTILKDLLGKSCFFKDDHEGNTAYSRFVLNIMMI